MEIQKFYIGDIVELKKKHPCGSFTWEIIRIGADFKIKCQGCEHLVFIPRHEFQKKVKKVIQSKGEE